MPNVRREFFLMDYGPKAGCFFRPGIRPTAGTHTRGDGGFELRQDIDAVTQPCMLIAMEPMLQIPEGMPGAGGFREHDIVGLNEARAENSTGYLYVLAHYIQ